MKRSFEIRKKIIKYDLNYYFLETKVLDVFMTALENFCFSELRDRIAEMKPREIGVSEILKIVNSGSDRDKRTFNEHINDEMFKYGLMVHFTYLILSQDEIAKLRLESIEFIISHFTVLYQFYDISDFELIEQKLQKVKLTKEEKEASEIFSATVKRASNAEKIAKEKFSKLQNLSESEIDDFYKNEFNFETASLAELRQNWLLWDVAEWFSTYDWEIENLNEKWNYNDKVVREAVKESIEKGCFTISACEAISGKSHNYRQSLKIWLLEHGIISELNLKTYRHKIFVKSLNEFDKKFE